MPQRVENSPDFDYFLVGRRLVLGAWWPTLGGASPGRPAAASGARAIRLQSRRSHCLPACRYTERQRFKFKLSYWQCRDLIQTLCRYDAKLRARRICDQYLGYRTDVSH